MSQQVTPTLAFVTQCPCLLRTVVVAGALSTSRSDSCQPEDTSQPERAVAVSFLDGK